MKVKVRIAPSPSGNLHIGAARTTLFNWLFANKNGGEFVLRIEDTDLERSDKKYEEDILESLRWLGLDWSGEIYRQSERLDIYEKYINQLFDSGKAFWCHHTKEELEKEKKGQEGRKEASRHICEHKRTELGKQKGQIIRLAVDENSMKVIRFDDEIRGTIEWGERLVGDLSLAKDIRVPLYNFAVVADDVDMEISHVIRGEDHISNTPKQILIYEALGKEHPIFAHLPLIFSPNKAKLSKRHNAVSVTEYKKDYLPEALVNFMGFLGYTYSREILSKEEMAEEFELSKVHRSGAVFNVEKLNWINSQYVRKLTASEFRELVDIKVPDAAVPLMTERLEKLSDVQDLDYFWKEPNYDSDLLNWKSFSSVEIKSSLEETRMLINGWDWNNFDKGAMRLALDDLGKKLGDPAKSPNDDRGASRGLVYWPFRVALTGRNKSPDPVEVASVLDKDIVLQRIDMAINKLT